MSETKQRTLILGGDFEGDLEAIVKALNGGQRFVVDHGRIVCGKSAARLRICASHEVDELSNESVDWDFDEYEELRLAELSETIAPLLTRGTLELGSAWKCKTGAIHIEKLAICSDGWVQHENTWLPCEARNHLAQQELYERHRRRQDDQSLV